MKDEEIYLERLFQGMKIPAIGKRKASFEAFVKETEHLEAVQQILENQKMLQDKWKLINRINDVKNQSFRVSNATVGKAYEHKVDFERQQWTDFSFSDISGLEDIGLSYDNEAETISGTPTEAGDFKLTLLFRIKGEDPEKAPNEKSFSLVINPDPKSLWKDIDSDKEAPFWKPDNVSAKARLGNRNLVAVSKRGRSHANVGSFRDDDFAFEYHEKTGWSIVAVSDGAGSAKISRQGSKMACEGIVDYFTTNIDQATLDEFDAIVQEQRDETEGAARKLNNFVYTQLGGAVLNVHKKMAAFAKEHEYALRDLHSTLIFVLMKEYDFGTAMLSFGVGDCPIGVLNENQTEIELMNWLDVGEFGGGTRFVTMPEIFSDAKFGTRFGFKLAGKFSYLMLMSDGVYDPKFEVEANLEKVEKWQEFVKDLQGDNEDGVAVNFDPENEKVDEQLSQWMDFWSPGNHDDRTLVVIY